MTKSAQPRKSMYSAAALSFMFPGLGQVFQRRYLQAAIFLGTCLVCLGVFIGCLVKIAAQVIGLINDVNAEISARQPVISLVLAFAAIIVIWLIGLGDTILASRRQAKKGKKPPQTPPNPKGS